MPEPLDYRKPSTVNRRESRFVKGLLIIFGPAAIGVAFGTMIAIGWLLILGGWGLPELVTFCGLFGGIGLIVGLLRANAYFGGPGVENQSNRRTRRRND